MYKYFLIFLICSVLVGGSGALLILTYLTNNEVNLVHLFKIPLVIMFVTMCIFHLKYRLKATFPVILLMLFAILALGIGMINGTLLKTATIVHIYFTVMPMLAISFGYYFAKYYSPAYQQLMRRTILSIFLTSFCTLLVYYYHYYISHQIKYFGFGSELPIVGALLLSNRSYGYYLSTLVLVLLSGKRSSLISLMAPLSAIIINQLGRFNARRTLYLSLLVTSLFVVGFIFYRLNLMARFEYFLTLDLTSDRGLYIATSGRSDEIMGIIRFMNQDPMRWLIGAGWGGEYLIKSSWYLDELPYLKHYAHLSVLTYAFIFGAPFTISVFGYIFYIFWKNRSLVDNFFYLATIALFINSIFGALMMIDPMFWFLLGVNIYLLKFKENSSLIRV